MDNNANAWSGYADEYNANATFSSEFIHTGLGLVGISPSSVVKSSDSILDIGCGNGVNTFLLSKQTGGTVVGIDPVASQIHSAIGHFACKKLEFICCEFQNISDHIADCYDLLTFFGSIDYICIDETFFGIIKNVTHSGSRCFISKFHPFWTTLYGNDIEGELDNSYFDNERRDSVRFGSSEFVRYHYSLSDFLVRFTSHGWRLKEYSEPRPDFAHSAFAYQGYEQDPILRRRLDRIPMTAVFEFTREA